MIEQRIVNKAVNRYQRLDEILRSRVLKDEEAAFLRGRKHELMLLIYTLDKQAITQLTKNLIDNEPEWVNIGRIREAYLNQRLGEVPLSIHRNRDEPHVRHKDMISPAFWL